MPKALRIRQVLRRNLKEIREEACHRYSWKGSMESGQNEPEVEYPKKLGVVRPWSPGLRLAV